MNEIVLMRKEKLWPMCNLRMELAIISWERNFLLVSDHRPLEFIFYLRRELPKGQFSSFVTLGYLIVSFWRRYQYENGQAVFHVDALSRLCFEDDNCVNPNNIHLGDSVVHWTETNVISKEELR